MTVRPLQHLHWLNAAVPNAIQRAENLRTQRGKKGTPSWPEWCWMPIAGYIAILSNGQKDLNPAKLFASGIMPKLAPFAALHAWSATQGIYRWNRDLLDAVLRTPADGTLPTALLWRLPEWCVYVDLSWADPAHKLARGFYAHLEEDANTKRSELRLLIDQGDDAKGNPRLLPQVLHLSADSLVECYASATQESLAKFASIGLPLPTEEFNSIASRMAPLLAPYISLLLYLCSDEPDITRAGCIGGPTRRFKANHDNTAKMPSAPRAWEVGYRIGPALRQAMDEADQENPHEPGERQPPRPHIRRAHWHTFLSGPRDQDRLRRVKWIPPTLIGAGGIVPTIRVV